MEDIYDAYCRVQALHKFRHQHDHFPLLYEVYKRAKGQIGTHAGAQFSEKLLMEPAEKNLHQQLNHAEIQFSHTLAGHDYDKAYEVLAQIQPALASLFDNVKILADDPNLQNNRIALLQRVFALFAKVLDFSKYK